MKKINSGINLFKLFSMFMIAQLHILGMGGIIGATAGTAAYYHAFFTYRNLILTSLGICLCLEETLTLQFKTKGDIEK